MSLYRCSVLLSEQLYCNITNCVYINVIRVHVVMVPGPTRDYRPKINADECGIRKNVQSA